MEAAQQAAAISVTPFFMMVDGYLCFLVDFLKNPLSLDLINGQR
jgi:hypothetical protein